MPPASCPHQGGCLRSTPTTLANADGTAIVMHDRDTKFTASFDEALKAEGIKVLKTAHRAPNTVAFVERFIQTLQ